MQATVERDRPDVAEVAWVVGSPWQRRGIARAAAGLLAASLAGDGVRRLVAHIRPGHAASERVAEHLGLAPTDVVVDGETRREGPVAR